MSELPRLHPEQQVRPIERSDQRHRIVEAELLDDVLADPRRGGGGEGVETDARQCRAKGAELSILRAEVVAPVADAMRFVDRDEAERAGRLQQQYIRRRPRRRGAPGKHIEVVAACADRPSPAAVIGCSARC